MVLSLSFTIFDIALDRRHLGKPGTSSRFLSTFPIFAKNRMRGPDKFRQIWLTVRLPLFLQKDKLAGQTIAAAACETIGSNPGTPSPYLFCYRLSCRSTRHNSYAAPSVFRNCRKMVNMLTGRSGLAKVSGTPGKTRLINHFRINDSWYLVDLPGYGYARTSKTQRDEFAKIITDYVLRCERMHFLFVLVDSRLEPQKIDLRFIEMLGREGIPFGIVFTKTDKLSAAQLARSVERYKQVLGEQWEELPPMFRSSSEKRTGREEILDFIGKCLTEC